MRPSVIELTAAEIALHMEAETQNCVALYRTWHQGLISTYVGIHIVRIHKWNRPPLVQHKTFVNLPPGGDELWSVVQA